MTGSPQGLENTRDLLSRALPHLRHPQCGWDPFLSQMCSMHSEPTRAADSDVPFPFWGVVLRLLMSIYTCTWMAFAFQGMFDFLGSFGSTVKLKNRAFKKNSQGAVVNNYPLTQTLWLTPKKLESFFSKDCLFTDPFSAVGVTKSIQNYDNCVRGSVCLQDACQRGMHVMQLLSILELQGQKLHSKNIYLNHPLPYFQAPTLESS